METRILNGRAVADAIKRELEEEIGDLRSKGLSPGLSVILVGENPASAIYVKNKTRSSEQLGIRSETIELPVTVSTEELLSRVGELNRNDEVDGILVQLPLPDHIDQDRVLQAVHPAKDVDGFHPVNVGKLSLGRPALAPCTPMGILELLKRERIPLSGAEAVVVGRSNIVGKPTAMLLLREHCTVTICHSRTRDLAAVCRRADLLVAAVGRPALIGTNHLKQGAVVIDVGINRVTDRDLAEEYFGADSPRLETFDRKGYCLVGDVHPRAASGVASAVTPVPGGVGPLTIAHLMKNTVTACRMRRASSPRTRRARRPVA